MHDIWHSAIRGGLVLILISPVSSSSLLPFRYSSLISTGTVRSASVTRIDGRTLTLVPYSKEHVPIVHGWMQQPEVFTGFGVQPPTLEQVRAWPPPVVLLERVSALLSCGNWAVNWLGERESA